MEKRIGLIAGSGQFPFVFSDKAREKGYRVYAAAYLKEAHPDLKNHVDAMCTELNIDLDRIIVSGGGSSGDLFMQIFSDVFGIPAVRNVVNGAAGLGSAICAAVAVGAYEQFTTAIEQMVRIRDRFQPIAENTVVYEKMNDAVYKHITRFTDPVLEKSYRIFKQ